MVAQSDISIRRNEVWGRTLTLYDSAGQPFDLTGATGQFHVRSRTDNATLVASGALDFADAAFGKVNAVLRADEGQPLYSYGSPLQVENLRYDIRITLPSGLKRDIFAGTVILSRGISHD